MGQILPCPKCGSMVLIAAPASPVDDASRQSSVVHTTAKPNPLPVTDSFERLDELLDDHARTRQSAENERGDRWREPTQPAESTSSEPTLAENPRGADVDAQTASSDWVAGPSALAKYIIGGAVLGVAMAIGLVGVLLTRPANNQSNDIISNVIDSESKQQGETPLDPTRTQSQAPDVDDASELKADSPEPPDNNLTSASVTAETPSAAVADSEDHAADQGAEATTAADDEPSGQVELAVSDAEPPALPDDDDGLADLARWLQNPSVDLQPDSSPPPASTSEPAAESEPITRLIPSRPVPELVNVEARLKEPIAAIEFIDVPLTDVMRSVTDFSTIPITLDPKALARRNLSPLYPITTLKKGTNVQTFLTEILQKLRLGYELHEGHLVVTTAAQAKGELVRIRHELGNLLQGGATASEMRDWIVSLIAPETWQQQGGQGTIDVDGSVLSIKQLDTVHYDILVFCEKLRIARGLPPISRINRKKIQLTSRVTSAQKLTTPITLHVWRDSNLGSVASEFQRQTDMAVLVDWQALHSAGWSPADQIKFFCREQPMDQALDALLEPMGLAYRVIDQDTIEISTPMAVASMNEIEFYRLADAANSSMTADEASEQILRKIGRARFQPVGAGSIALDTVSQTFIVSLPQPAQRDVEELLLGPPAAGD